MKTIIFCVVISLISTEDGYHRYLCKSNENEKGTVFSYGDYQKGDTIWINPNNSN